MSYNFGNRNLPQQTQEILREKQRSQDILKEDEKKRIEQVKEKVLAHLSKEEAPQSINKIAELIKVKGPDVLKAVNQLTKERNVKMTFDEVEKVKVPKYYV
jgi:DNA-binding MarR family transcriptional regulator